MTKLSNELVAAEPGHYKTILVPKHHLELNGGSWKYISQKAAHPITGKTTEYMIAKSGNLTELYTLNKINWTNNTLKNLATTPDGKPYRCLFITKENADDAIVIGSSPDLYMLGLFSPVYFLIAHFKQLLFKANNDNADQDKKRMISLEDLADSICDSNEFLKLLVSEYGVNLQQWIEQTCEKVSVPSMDSDEEVDQEDAFYKPSLKVIVNFIDAKINALSKSFSDKQRFIALNMKMDAEFTEKPSEKILALLWKKQAIDLMRLFVDGWYLEMWMKEKNIDFSELEAFNKAELLRKQAQDTFSETLDQMHEGSLSAERAKRVKPSVKVKPKPKATVKVKSGALDMFFKKKEA